MTAFSDAFFILKNEHRFDLLIDSVLRKGKAEDAIALQQMRQFVLDNENSPDPAMRQAAEDMYQKLTQMMSQRRGVTPTPRPEGPVGEGAEMTDMSQPAMPPQHPMKKAWDSLRKNVVGMDYNQKIPAEYNMPPAVASMAQRPQVPETKPHTVTYPAQGLFSRLRGRQSQTYPRRTGHTVSGGPTTMDVQENPPHPMGEQFGAGPAPGAQVERMPPPDPYSAFAGISTPYTLENVEQGLEFDKTGRLVM